LSRAYSNSPFSWYVDKHNLRFWELGYTVIRYNPSFFYKRREGETNSIKRVKADDKADLPVLPRVKISRLGFRQAIWALRFIKIIWKKEMWGYYEQPPIFVRMFSR